MRVVILAAVCCGVACSESVGPDHRDDPLLSTWVTPELHRYIDARGMFVLPEPEPRTGTVSPLRARALGLSWVQSFAFAPALVGRPLWELIERDHGRPIDWARLSAENRIYFAESPYELLPADYPTFVRRWSDNFFFVRIRAAGVPVATVAVPAHSVFLDIMPDGRLSWPSDSGPPSFPIIGIPRQPEPGQAEYPLAPELAVRIAAEGAQLKVAALPRLLIAGRPYASVHARWDIRLDAPVEAIGVLTGQRYIGTNVYVSWDRAIEIPWPDQPAADSLLYPGTGGQTFTTAYLVLRAPVRFEPVLTIRPYQAQ